MKPIATKSENWIFFTLCSINLNMVSISGTGNVQLVFNLDPCVMNWLEILVQPTVWFAQHKFFLVSLPNHILVSCRSGELAGHVMYGDHLPIIMQGIVCLRMLSKCGGGFVKEQVYRTPIPVLDLLDLQERIYAAVNNVIPEMLHNTWVEVEYLLDISRATNGSHVEMFGT